MLSKNATSNRLILPPPPPKFGGDSWKHHCNRPFNWISKIQSNRSIFLQFISKNTRIPKIRQNNFEWFKAISRMPKTDKNEHLPKKTLKKLRTCLSERFSCRRTFGFTQRWSLWAARLIAVVRRCCICCKKCSTNFTQSNTITELNFRREKHGHHEQLRNNRLITFPSVIHKQFRFFFFGETRPFKMRLKKYHVYKWGHILPSDFEKVRVLL